MCLVRDDIRQDALDRARNAAFDLIRENGVRALRMDDVASRVSMSKRTIYEMFGDKEGLLLSVISLAYGHAKAELAQFRENDPDILDIVLCNMHISYRMFSSLGGDFMENAGKFPKVMEYFERMHVEHGQKSLSQLLECQEAGYIRKDMDMRNVFRMIDNIMQHLADISSGLDKAETFRMFFLVSIRGMATPCGVERIDRFFAKPLDLQEF